MTIQAPSTHSSRLSLAPRSTPAADGEARSKAASASNPEPACRSVSVTIPWFKTLGMLALLWSLVPNSARAELMIPVTLRITELIQIKSREFPPNLADLYAVVTINNQEFQGPTCDPSDITGFILPYTFFNETGSSEDCGDVPWTFETEVPLSTLRANPTGIAVQIRIIDDDLVFDDELEVINLRVPFGGRWSGRVAWPQNCVNDSDAGVCWQIEMGKDSDGDGLLDDWETQGLDTDGDGDIDLALPSMGANPNHKDLYVELDWRKDFPPKRAEVQKWVEAFAAAPIDAGGIPNPDGLPGINLHVDTGALTEGGQLVGENLGGGNELAATFPVCSLEGKDYGLYAAKPTNFDAATRELVFRYGIVSTQCCLSGTNIGAACFNDVQCPGPGGACQPAGGRAEIGGNDFVTWNYDRFLGSTLMHELGHTLNLHHGGGGDPALFPIKDNCKPNYLSIMNYHHFVIQRLDGSEVLDFSPPRQTTGARGQAPLPDLGEDHLDETFVLDPTDQQTLLAYTVPPTAPLPRKRLSPVGAPVDWNGDGVADDTDTSVNIDTSDDSGYPENCTNDVIRPLVDPDGSNLAQVGPLKGYNDWQNVSLPFLQFGESADGPINPVPEREPTGVEIEAQLQGANTTDLAVTKTGDPGPYEAGSSLSLSYLIRATNQGPNPALPLLVGDTLPDGASLRSAEAACQEDVPGHLTCRYDGVLSGQFREVPMSLDVTAGCSGGLPTPIVNRASVANGNTHAGADPDPSDDSASFTTTVVDTTPPELTLFASPSQLWPPNHALVPITVTVTTEDVCDEHPTVRLVSIVSNEGTLANGSGHTSPDVAGAAFNTDDRNFQLRAERRGSGNGRIYTITYEAKDASGNITISSVTVTVAQSQGLQ